MELLDIAAIEAPDTETILGLEDLELDRIAFELWQRCSLPALVECNQPELEEVACHASCL